MRRGALVFPLLALLLGGAPVRAGELAALEAARTEAEALAAQGKFAEAREALAPLLRRHSDVYWLALRYAFLSYRAGKLDDAEKYYDRAARLGPMEEAPVEGSLAIALARNDPDWRRRADLLLRLNPGNRAANLQIAYSFMRNGLYDSAAQTFSQMIGRDPADADALTGLGWVRVYQGSGAVAHGYFKRALASRPGDASARQGLGATRAFNFEVAPYHAFLSYKGTPLKRGGYSEAVPVTFSWRQWVSATMTYTKTLIRWNSPDPDVRQREWNGSLTLRPIPGLALVGGYNRIFVNDPITDGGKVYTAGGTMTLPFPDYPRASLTVGGYGAYSRYNGLVARQLSPRVGAGVAGVFSAELSATHIQETRARGKYTSVALAGSLGPFHGFSLTGSTFAGKKLLAIDNWGLVAANTPDLYRGGWRAGLSWSNQRLTVFGLFGKDKIRAFATPANIDYMGTVAVLGAACRLGL